LLGGDGEIDISLCVVLGGRGDISILGDRERLPDEEFAPDLDVEDDLLPAVTTLDVLHVLVHRGLLW